MTARQSRWSVRKPGALFVGAAVLWSVVVAMALFIHAPFGVTDTGVLTSGLMKPGNSRYLGYCPMPLAVYFFAGMLMRHPLALVLASEIRGKLEPAWNAMSLARALGRAWITWIVLAGGAAFVVRAGIGRDAASLAWAVEIAKLTIVAGLPCMTLATTMSVLAKKTSTFWILTPLLLILLAIFSLGLRGDRVPPVFPGAIEVALTSGRETLRARAFFGAVAWPVMGLLWAGASSLWAVVSGPPNGAGKLERSIRVEEKS
jgi:hypothetical protein